MLLCCRLVFAYQILTPAALQFFVSYADGAVESLWSIDQYFEFVLVLLLSTGLSFQVCLCCSYAFNVIMVLLPWHQQYCILSPREYHKVLHFVGEFRRLYPCMLPELLRKYQHPAAVEGIY